MLFWIEVSDKRKEMAGGSQIIISDEGITISTNGKILYKAGQHKFESSERVVRVKSLKKD